MFDVEHEDDAWELGVCHTAIILDHGSVMAEGCPDAIVHGPTEIRLFAFVKHRQLPTQFPLTLLC